MAGILTANLRWFLFGPADVRQNDGGHRGGQGRGRGRGSFRGRGQGHQNSNFSSSYSHSSGQIDATRFFRPTMLVDPWASLGDGTPAGKSPIGEGLMNIKGEVLIRISRPGRGGGRQPRYHEQPRYEQRGFGDNMGAMPPPNVGPTRNEDEIELDMDDDMDDGSGQRMEVGGDLATGQFNDAQLPSLTNDQPNNEEIQIDIDDEDL